MKRTGKRMVMLMTVLFLLIIGFGATIAWGDVTIPTKAERYDYNMKTKKWKKSKRSFTATFAKSGKLQKVTYYVEDVSETKEYQWKGDYLKKSKESVSYSKDTDVAIYTYTKNKLLKETGKGWKRTYKWNGNKGTVTYEGDDTETYFITLKNGRKSKTIHSDYTYEYSYRKKGLIKSLYDNDPGLTCKQTYNKMGFPEKISYGNGAVTTLKWKKNNVIITVKDRNGKITEKTKFVFKKKKKVRRAWNCDAFGTMATIDFFF